MKSQGSSSLPDAATARRNMSEERTIEELLDSLGWDGQVGQMAQLDINMLLTDDHKELRQDLLDHYIGTLGVGSVLNNQNKFEPLWKMEDFRAAVLQVQATAEKFGRPPVIWGLDSVHGANYLYDTIITPQPINLAASFNSSLAYQAGWWASRDTRRAGIPWLFSPLLGLSWNPFWSRVYETFGEDPVLVGEMALAMTQGIQTAVGPNGDNSTIIPSRAAACGKHFVGYSMPHNGHDRAPSWIPTRHLYQYFVPPWKQVSKIVDTVMESYTEIDGVPNVANRQTLNRLLRHELDFEGMLVTDYHEIFNLFEWHHTAKDRNDAMIQSLSEGSVDMSMIANEPQDFFDAYQTLSSSDWKERVRTSARRVLELKKKLGMFEESFTMTMEDAQGPGHSSRDVELALDMTHQSIVLAKNEDNILPLDSEKPLRVLVTGPTANAKSFTTGGWTWQWQGADSNIEDQWFTYGSTVVEALQQEQNWQVSYSCGVDIMGRDCNSSGDFEGMEPGDPGVMGTLKGWVGWNGQEPELSVERAMNLADNQDVIVVCVGEENYTEKPGDIRSLRLPDGQYELVSGLRHAAPDAKIVLAYFGGRPRLLADIEVRNPAVVSFVSALDLVLTLQLPFPIASCGCSLFGFLARATRRRSTRQLVDRPCQSQRKVTTHVSQIRRRWRYSISTRCVGQVHQRYRGRVAALGLYRL
jgi:beta-glucosidase